jgi:hypothetical protein
VAVGFEPSLGHTERQGHRAYLGIFDSFRGHLHVLKDIPHGGQRVSGRFAQQSSHLDARAPRLAVDLERDMVKGDRRVADDHLRRAFAGDVQGLRLERSNLESIGRDEESRRGRS